ncbi:pilus assembly protein HofO [Enterobacter sp. BIGb0383]|uniref:HofO family protein n=1 Tax=unclassified Enterobacter TaxID=2608935 RepID=UPI000F9292CA|nr:MULTISPECIES: HofO [unclassified Enterobacter]ROP56434.1 pilus assembly protein HofO [Enterobacter sp. BIGb0383]ROS04500.1 pilus assembly protein HofO [Enterobacter sp. BIGb0359]
MLPNPERWRDLRPGVRVVIWLGTLCALAALWAGGFLLGPYQAHRSADAELQGQQAALRAQRRQLREQEQALARDSAEQTVRLVPFSALNFQSAEAQLVSWKPDEKGGELVLETSWSPLPAMFQHLAEQDMTPASFAIEPEGRLLHFTLHLESFRER